jgi:hypothetical protein
MDSSMMSGMDGEGMDMSSDPMFRTFNQVLARGYWYTIASVLGFMVLLRMINFYQAWSRLVQQWDSANHLKVLVIW